MDNTELERRAMLCISDYDGIIPHFGAFYIHSIIYSASRCLDSFDRYEVLKAQDVSAAELISILQEAVGHSAALSRYFWPSFFSAKKSQKQSLAKLKDKRAEKLRKAFYLDDKSVLCNRDMRNAWEHFDERLDFYLLENCSGYFFPSCIIGDHELANDPAGHIFKLLDVKNECLVLLGKKYFFQPIRKSAEAILVIAMRMNKNGASLQRISP